MAEMSYLGVIERYHEYGDAIRELLASIVTGIADRKLLGDEARLQQAMDWLGRNYPFVDLIYSLDAEGIQTSENVTHQRASIRRTGPGKGSNRSQRPYFLQAQDSDGVTVTEPYLSVASHRLCISAAVRCKDPDGSTHGYLIVDINLGEAVSYLMGDRRRRFFHPVFMTVYSLIVLGLFAVVAVLGYSAFTELAMLFYTEERIDLHLKPFGVIIFLTLALAIFDLGKTILEEEVLMHKDIFRHSSTRRTITRFIGAILIAVSIESLLMMFKSVLGDTEHLGQAVTMMAAAVGLLVGLGIYVYLGARAEYTLWSKRFLCTAEPASAARQSVGSPSAMRKDGE